jgi:hypothetical protein
MFVSWLACAYFFVQVPCRAGFKHRSTLSDNGLRGFPIVICWERLVIGYQATWPQSILLSGVSGGGPTCQSHPRSGAMALGQGVASTIRKGIVDVHMFDNTPELLMFGNWCAVVGSACWVAIATIFNLPVSSTHAVIGAILVRAWCITCLARSFLPAGCRAAE